MRSGALLLAASLSLTAASAWGDSPVPSLDLREFHPPVDPAGFLYLEPARTPGGGQWNFGAYASYALSPIVLHAADGHGHIVDHAEAFTMVGKGVVEAASDADGDLVFEGFLGGEDRTSGG